MQVARRRGCGFCQLHLSADAATAAQLNQRREAACRVDEAVIRTMAAKLEPPDPLANTWERFSFTIPVSDGADTNFGNIFFVEILSLRLIIWITFFCFLFYAQSNDLTRGNVWLYCSPIPVERRGVISSFKGFLPAFATRRERRRGGTP